ncbi:hypothetical protein AVEN_250920-1, partial [Araneus ventricosus]
MRFRVIVFAELRTDTHYSKKAFFGHKDPNFEAESLDDRDRTPPRALVPVTIAVTVPEKKAHQKVKNS